MKSLQLLALTIGVLFIPTRFYSQTFFLQPDQQEIFPGDTVNCQLLTKDFNQMVSLQMAITWDSTLFQLIHFEKQALDDLVVGPPTGQTGKLSMSWIASERVGTTLADTACLLSFQLVARTCDPGYTKITFDNQHLAPEFYQAQYEKLVAVSPTLVDGLLKIQLPNLIPQPDTLICLDEQLELSVSNCSSCSFVWSNGATTSRIMVADTGSYSLIATTPDQCTYFDTIIVQSIPENQGFATAEFNPVCKDEPLHLIGSGGEYGFWLDTTGWIQDTLLREPLIHPTHTATFWYVTIGHCDTDTAELTVDILESDGWVSPDTCIVLGETISLAAGGGDTYQWTNPLFPIQLADTPNPEVNPTQTTYFQVSIVNDQNCTYRDSVLVTVVDGPEEIIPKINIITPNGDQLNDQLYFPNLEKFPLNRLEVFNRWGDLVFSKNNYQQDDSLWDGTFRGKRLPPGTYYYELHFKETILQQYLTISY